MNRRDFKFFNFCHPWLYFDAFWKKNQWITVNGCKIDHFCFGLDTMKSASLRASFGDVKKILKSFRRKKLLKKWIQFMVMRRDDQLMSLTSKSLFSLFRFPNFHVVNPNSDPWNFTKKFRHVRQDVFNKITECEIACFVTVTIVSPGDVDFISFYEQTVISISKSTRVDK